jgi:hypothetical protein
LVDHGLRLLDDTIEVVLTLEALGIDLADVLGARGTCGEGAVLRDHLEAADGKSFPGAGSSMRSIASSARLTARKLCVTARRIS